MVNDSGVPGQPKDETGVTVIVAVTGVLVLLIAVKAGMLPVPLAAKPIDVLLLIQLKLVPATEPEKLTTLVNAPSHKAWFAGLFTSGDGLIVMVNVFGVPLQLDR